MKSQRAVRASLLVVLGLTALLVVKNGITGYAAKAPHSAEMSAISLFIIIAMMIGIYRWFKE